MSSSSNMDQFLFGTSCIDFFTPVCLPHILNSVNLNYFEFANYEQNNMIGLCVSEHPVD